MEERSQFFIHRERPIILQDRYELCKQLNAKAGKRTFLAQDLVTQIPVILKVLLMDQEFQWGDLKLFEREAKVLQNLSHPAIPQYLDYFEFKHQDIHGFAIVQTYIDAPNLEQVVQSGRRFSEAELVELARRLLKILSYLHGKIPLVIHRDIKPSNILLSAVTSDGHHRADESSLLGTVHLVDFGSVQASLKGEPGTITIVGSYGYIPLEQFGGQAVPASDLYSLGITMLYLASGTHPSEMALAKDNSIKIELPQVSFSYRQWLKKMVHPYLGHRYGSADEAHLALLDPAQTAASTAPTFYGDNPPKSGFILLEQGERLVVKLPVKEKPEATPSEWFWIVFLLIMVGPMILTFILSLLLIPILAALIFIPLIHYAFQAWINKRKNRIKYLSIDQEKISTYHSKTAFVKQKPSRQNRRVEILSLIYRPSYTLDECFDLNENRIQIINGSTRADFCIYAGENQYQIVGLKANEFWELGQLISDFLDIKLQVIYPTPKIPNHGV